MEVNRVVRMKTETLQSFNPRSADYQFRWSLGKSVVPTFVFSLLTLAGLNEMFGPRPFTEIPTFPLIIVTAGFALCALVAWAQTRAGFGKNALVAALDSKSLWVRVRSPLNAHIGSEKDDLLVALPVEQLRSSQITTVVTIRTMNNKPRSTFEKFLDLEFRSLDTAGLKEVLDRERKIRKSVSQSHLHFPVSLMDDERVRLCLDSVVGGTKRVQQALPSSVEAKSPATEKRDLR